ncbi:MAG: 50S ribosomal protein L20 [Patescibacteria group bacterium]|jgi:large subunit ribosomal protein L20
MPRVKRGKTHVAKRKRLFQKTKGYRWGRKNTIRLAKTAINKAGVHAYTGRKKKKRVNRALWQIQINAGTRQYDLSYSKFIHLLKKNKIDLDRKVLAELAGKQPKVFAKIISEVKK